MDGLTQTLIGLAISGITFIAYKHPEAYRKLELPQIVFKMITVFFGGFILWSFAVKQTASNLAPFIKESAVKDVNKVIESMTLPLKGMILLGAFFFAFWLFFVVLYFLHSFLGIKPKKD